jgi:hypothetical protein
MPRFRIKEEIIKSEGEFVKFYTVEKNVNYFWWKRESKEVYGLVDVFQNYDEAVKYIKEKNGMLMYIC